MVQGAESKDEGEGLRFGVQDFGCGLQGLYMSLSVSMLDTTTLWSSSESLACMTLVISLLSMLYTCMQSHVRSSPWSPPNLTTHMFCTQRHVCVMLWTLYFPVTCKSSRAVTLPNIGVPHGVTYPYSLNSKRSVQFSIQEHLPRTLCSSSEEGSYLRLTDFCIPQLQA